LICNKSLKGKRSNAKTCSEACRQEKRRREIASRDKGVTETPVRAQAQAVVTLTEKSDFDRLFAKVTHVEQMLEVLVLGGGVVGTAPAPRKGLPAPVDEDDLGITVTDMKAENSTATDNFLSSMLNL